MKPGDVAGVARYVLKQSKQYQLDPNAVVAVAIQEGLLTKNGAPGDNGTSFGPWQLHVGGAYPKKGAPDPSNQDAANAWAWSPAGIDYALGRMQTVAGGLKGRKAVHAIVYQFERPADPSTEYNNAVQALPSNDGGPAGGSNIIGDIVSGIYHGSGISTGVDVVTGAVSTGEAVVSGTEAVGNFLGKLLDPHFWLRALEVAGGAFFVLLALYLLGREAGVVDKAKGAVGAAAAVAQPELAPAVAAQRQQLQANQAARQQRRAARARKRELDAKYGAEAPF